MQGLRTVLTFAPNDNLRPRLQILEERARIRRAAIIHHLKLRLSLAEEGIGQRVFWTIPNDSESTTAAINEGKVLSQVARRSSVTKAIRGLAATLVREAGGEPVQAKNRWRLPKLWQSRKAIRDEDSPVREQYEQPVVR